MTNGTADVTRGEFNLLKESVDRNERRIETIDDHGTRGVGVLQNQMLDLSKDVAKLEIALEHHELGHKEERNDRVRNRKWVLGAVIGGLASMATVISLLLELVLHAHGG